MNKIHLKYMISALSISALLATSGCTNTTQQTFPEDAVIPVNVAKVQKELITSGKVYSGVVKPSEEISIIPKIAGRVAELPVEIGMPVKKGQVLLKLEDKELQNAVKKAVAATSVAEANIRSAETTQKSGVNQAESGVVQVKGSLVQAENSMLQAENSMLQAEDNIAKTENAVKQAENAVKDSELALKKSQQQLDDAKTNYERKQQLYTGSLISKEELEKSESALVTAQANYDSSQTANNNVIISLATAQKNYESAQKNYESAQKTYTNAKKSYDNTSESFVKAQQQVDLSKNSAGIEASKAAWKQAQLAVDIANETLADAVITSPISGIISTKNTNVGQMVSVQSPALVVVNLETVRVLTYIPAADINTIKQGDSVQVKSVSFDNVTQGTVKTISPIDADGEGYPVEIEVSNPDLTLKSGMLVDLQFISNDDAEGMFIPVSAVINEDKKSYVYVTNGDHPERKEIEVGTKLGSKVIVKKGLTENDLIITDNLATLSSDIMITYK